MKDSLLPLFGIVLVLTMFVGSCYVEVATWRECRQQFSFIACMRMMSK